MNGFERGKPNQFCCQGRPEICLALRVTFQSFTRGKTARCDIHESNAR